RDVSLLRPVRDGQAVRASALAGPDRDLPQGRKYHTWNGDSQFTKLPTLLRQDSLSPFILLAFLLVPRRDLLRRHIDGLVPSMFGRSHRGHQPPHSECG